MSNFAIEFIKQFLIGLAFLIAMLIALLMAIAFLEQLWRIARDAHRERKARHMREGVRRVVECQIEEALREAAWAEEEEGESWPA